MIHLMSYCKLSYCRANLVSKDVPCIVITEPVKFCESNSVTEGRSVLSVVLSVEFVRWFPFSSLFDVRKGI